MPINSVNPNANHSAPISEGPVSPRQKVAPQTDKSTLESNESCCCLECVKYYMSALFNSISSICSFIYNLLFGSNAAPEKKAEEKAEAPEVKEEPKPELMPANKESNVTPAAASEQAAQPTAPPAVTVEQPQVAPTIQLDQRSQTRLTAFRGDKEQTIRLLGCTDPKNGRYLVRNIVRGFIQIISRAPTRVAQSYIDANKLDDLVTLADEVWRDTQKKEQLIAKIEQLPDPTEFSD